jgi:hypothetical protein
MIFPIATPLSHIIVLLFSMHPAPMYIVNGAAGHYDGLDPLLYPLQNYSAFATDKVSISSHIIILFMM